MYFTTIQRNLEKRGYKVSCFSTVEEANAYLRNEIRGTTVGMGGSMTILEMGLYEELEGANEVYWHWKGDNPAEALQKAKNADVYISSVNGMAETGEIINIDGSGNRVAATIWGHKKVYLIAGENKIAETKEGAMERARNIAGPLNAKRLGRKTPCAEKGNKCYDCTSPERICCTFNTFERPTMGCEFEVILIHENLGY